MIAAFTVPDEPEPGLLSVRDDTVRAVHLTLLKPDGSAKADTAPSKFIVGSPHGLPIVLAPANDLPPGIGGRLPTWWLITRNSAMIAAWFVVML